MEQVERAFLGIWIPKEIWLSKDLSLQEKVFLVEINSLDNENGCFASNKYFSEFFGVTSGRASQIINSLNKKGYISIEYEREGKAIVKRVIRILNTYLINDETLFNKLNDPIKYPKEGYLENAEDNNTSINNITINKHIYGEFKHVRLSDDDISKLKELTPNLDNWIKQLDEYIESSGKKYKNHYLTLRNWINREPKKDTELPGWYDNVPKEKVSAASLAEALELQKRLKGE